MSDAAHSHDAHDAHHDGPPTLPVVTDEAGDTPTWVPLTGLLLFAVIAVLIVFRSQTATDEAPAAEAADTAPAAEAEAAPVGEH
jgi:hypothetical protein